MTRDGLRSVRRLHQEMGNVLGVLANDPVLREHPGAVIAVLGVLAEDVQRASERSTSTIDPQEIEDAVDYLRSLRSFKERL